jgi:5-methylthioadenosine/S-adenosylhomocysteine deaminase
MPDLLLRAGAVVTVDSQHHVYQPGFVRVDGGRITEVGPGWRASADDGETTLDLPDRVVMPGLVNAHTHSPMVLFRGLAEGYSLLVLDGWLKAIRSWEAVLQPDMIPPAVAVSCAEMIRTGTTTFADQYFHMDRVLPVVAASGLRAALAYGIVELGDAEARKRALAETEAFLERATAQPRIRGWVGPHAFFVDNTPDAIQAELELARRHNTGLHIHLATSGEEDEFCQARFGVSAVTQMARLGVLDQRLLAAHCLTVPEDDFPSLAAAPFSAVLCASACMRSGAVPPPAVAMLDAGINLALGTDNVTNNNTYDMFNEMQTAAKLVSFSERRPAALQAGQILRMATMGGAAALGMQDEIGSLEAGKRADLILLDLATVGWTPRATQDITTALVYSVSGQQVTDSMVDGEWLLRDGAWTRYDYRSAVAELEAAAAELLARREA